MADITIDLNADLGEGFGRWSLTDDAALLDIVTSANVACGFHAGDPSTMRRVCRLAAERGVVVGAQVSYRDLVGFGRREMTVPAGELRDEIAYQIGALQAFARAAGTTVAYVKPHGALYNRAARDDVQARAVVDAVQMVDPTMALLGLAGSRLLAAGQQAGLRVVPEGFADRAYGDDAQLVPRGLAGSVLTNADDVAARAVRIARDHTAVSISGPAVGVHADSLCVHGDTPGAVLVARRVRAALEDAGIAVQAFV